MTTDERIRAYRALSERLQRTTARSQETGRMAEDVAQRARAAARAIWLDRAFRSMEKRLAAGGR